MDDTLFLFNLRIRAQIPAIDINKTKPQLLQKDAGTRLSFYPWSDRELPIAKWNVALDE